MKLIIAILLFIPIFAFADTSSIAPENMVVLHLDNVRKASWSPTQEQVNSALMKITAFLDIPSGVSDWQKNEISKIQKSFSDYKVQFVGIEVEGKKRIWCNFFRGNFDYWKTGVVLVLDGGCNFWQIEYDLKSGNCLNFQSNGYA